MAMLVLASGILAGCVHQYPASEAALKFTYPLKPCTPGKIETAGRQVTAGLGQLVTDASTVCVTGLAWSPVKATIAAELPAGAPATQIDDPCVGATVPDVALPDESPDEHTTRLAAQALSQQEHCLRRHLENPFRTAVRKPGQFGIALSGGGSKAAAFATGVLAGLADLRLLDRADYVSSVSGGSYAAYFYYAHRLLPVVRGGSMRVPVSSEELFRDCVALPGATHATPGVIAAIHASVAHCGRQDLHTTGPHPTPETALPVDDAGYQALVKCTQDLMRPGDCNMDATSSWHKGISLPTVGGTLATVIPAFVPNTLFDWGMATSPSAISYQDGIGIAYGATLADTADLSPRVVTKRARNCGAGAGARDMVLDCERDFFDPDPLPLTFDELRSGLWKMRKEGGDGMPFWIVNAAAPQYRSLYGWLRQGRKDITNSDMFEMTAVSHGSGRYGYVSASPAIQGMSVLDAVLASAAFLDANQLVMKNRLMRTGVGLGLHLANLDWGLDIANYNVSTKRREIHRLLPFPFYYLDDLVVRGQDPVPMTPERRDRERSVFIRLIDGGNAENLGVYSLLKRDVRNILIADAAADSKGQFSDLCGLRQRLLDTPGRLLPRHVFFPGLDDFDGHCKKFDAHKEDAGYDLHAWFAAHPLLLGCIRYDLPADMAQPCHNLPDKDARLLVAKPALDLPAFQKNQLVEMEVTEEGKTFMKSVLSQCWVRDSGVPTALLNCDTALFLHFNHAARKGDCTLFPQHSTWRMTANSSATLFVAYRELARQHVRQDGEILARLLSGNTEDAVAFESALDAQAKLPIKAAGPHCEQF
jgi:hypothetical protein